MIAARKAAGVLFAFASLCACGWPRPPLTHALEVRDWQSKCALIWFSGCAALLPEPLATDDDAGVPDAPADDNDAGSAEP
ncbi:MAG: hypothetical protein RL701_6812 [Pseudomonadota bacterium]